MPLRSRWALPGLGVVSRRASMAARCVEDTRKLGRAEGLRATQPVALCPGSLKVSHSPPLVQVLQAGHPIPQGESSVYQHPVLRGGQGPAARGSLGLAWFRGLCFPLWLAHQLSGAGGCPLAWPLPLARVTPRAVPGPTSASLLSSAPAPPGSRKASQNGGLVPLLLPTLPLSHVHL